MEENIILYWEVTDKGKLSLHESDARGDLFTRSISDYAHVTEAPKGILSAVHTHKTKLHTCLFNSTEVWKICGGA